MAQPLAEGVQFRDGWGEFAAHDVLHSARMMAHTWESAPTTDTLT